MSYRTSSFGGGNPFGFVITPWVKRLLIANGIVYLVTLALPGVRPFLWLVPAEIFPRVWTPFTYMFTHAGFLHLLFNMLVLFFFGPPLEEKWGGREFIKFYLIAGLGGALLSLVFPNQAIVGASGAVYGVMVAFAMYWPENPIYIWGIFPVKAKWLVGFLVGFSLFAAVSDGAGGSGVAHLAHLGGALGAFGYLKSPWAPSPWGEKPKRRRPRQWRVLSSSTAETPRKDATAAEGAPPSSAEIHRSLDEVDRILDKISSQGLESLTADERRMLDEASRRFRSN